ncbi:MAG TPA: cytochrome P450 [Kofleriaceae bacterium]|jgi:cytochrome P450|nr:cytochrome P450 [Kofleriaceae bacterium]
MQLFDDAMRRDPYPVYARLRTASPIFHVEAADVWMLLDHASVKRALHDQEVFSSAVGASRGLSFEWLMFMDPPRHTKLRAIINRAFTSRSIAALEPRIREIARGLVADVVARGTVDLEATLAAPLPMMVIAELLGLPVDDWRRLVGWSQAIMRLADTIIGRAADAQAASAAFIRADAEMREYLRELVAARRARPADDLLTRLVTAEIDGERLTDLELVRFFELLLAAGTETTTNLIDNAIVCLIDAPDQLVRLHADASLVPSAIEEVLRLRSPAQAVFRATKQAVEMHGVTIPAGKLVLPMLGSANRDPSAFAEPDRFDIGRDPNPHVAFGHGIHFCLGAPLSRLEARVALEELLPRVRAIEYAQDVAWPPRAPFHVHGPASLAVRLTR